MAPRRAPADAHPHPPSPTPRPLYSPPPARHRVPHHPTMTTATLPDVTLSGSAMSVLQDAKSVTFASTVEELVALAVPADKVDERGYYTVEYEVDGKMIPEAKVCRVRNGIAANYLEPYMRRRDPHCMVIADERATDKPTFKGASGTASTRRGRRPSSGSRPRTSRACSSRPGAPGTTPAGCRPSRSAPPTPDSSPSASPCCRASSPSKRSSGRATTTTTPRSSTSPRPSATPISTASRSSSTTAARACTSCSATTSTPGRRRRRACTACCSRSVKRTTGPPPTARPSRR